MLLELVLFVVLIAWFFGISYGAALHGIINFVFWAVVIGFVLSLFARTEPTPTPTPTPTPQKPTPPRKPIKLPPKLKSTLKWIIIFVVTYLITDLFLIAIGLGEQFIRHNVPLWISFSLPSIPFTMIVARHLIKKKTKTKKRTRK